MTDVHHGAGGCGALTAAAVASYASGGLDTAAEWSVEAHLPDCPVCRGALSASVDATRLQRNRTVLLARAGLPVPSMLSRTLRRCGVPDHVTALLDATPSLRRSWLAGVLLVLAIVVGASQLAAGGVWRPAGMPVHQGWAVLIPFLIITPLLPLAAVAMAFSPGLDPAWRLASAAPVSKVWLLCIRSAAVIAATLVPTALAALALPWSPWLAVALLLPALAICAAALALATVIRPEMAATAAGLAWIALVTGIAATAGRPASLFGPAGQVTAVAVVAAAAGLIAMRRNKIDYGWLG